MAQLRNPRLLKQRYKVRLHNARKHNYTVLIEEGTVERLQRIYEQWGIDAYSRGEHAPINWRVQDMAAWAVAQYAAEYDPLEEGVPWR